MNKLFVAIAILVVALLIFKHFYFPSGSTISQGGSQKPGPVNVTAIIVQPKSYNEAINVSGTLIANEELNLIPEISGKVQSLNFSEGQAVAQGQLLVKLNDAELQANKKKIQQQLDLLKSRENRAKQLLKVQGISQEEYDNLDHQIKSFESDLLINSSQIDKTEIRAPFHGVIGLKNISKGSFVNTNSIIASLQQLNPIKIEFSIPEKYSNQMKAGSIINFNTEDNKTYHGKIYAIEPKVNIITRTLTMRAQCSNENRLLLPGMFVQISVPLSKNDTSLLIPNEAILPELRGKKVFLIKEGKAIPQTIETGTRTEKESLVIRGLKHDDTIVVTGVQYLRPGIPVNITKLN